MAKGRAKADDDISKWPLERCFEELERIVAALESEATSLEESLKLFERGMQLSQRCTAELTAIERKIQLIVESSRGQAELQPFEDDAEDE
jgi:exodeoxyribonuclease VII small subunit